MKPRTASGISRRIRQNTGLQFVMGCLVSLMFSAVTGAQTPGHTAQPTGKSAKMIVEARGAAGAAANVASQPGTAGPEPLKLGLRAGYRIGPGDVLEINVWKEPQLSVGAAVVRSDGRISLPLVKEVDALGLTPGELEQVLSDKFSRFLEVPEVTVIVKEVHSEKVYVIGGVKKPGSVDLYSQLTVLQVLAEAGGLTEYAKKGGIFVLRKNGDKQVRLHFDYNAQLKGKPGKPEIVLQPGDTVVVPQ